MGSMTRKRFFTFLIVAVILTSAAAVYAAEGGPLQYQPLEPILPGSAVPNDAQFASYLNGAITVLITIGAMLAVLWFVIGGVEYMTSEAVGKKSDAVSRMQAALWGLLLLAGAVLILQTINPNLLNFNLGSLGAIGRGTSNNPSAPQNTQPGGTPVTGTQTQVYGY